MTFFNKYDLKYIYVKINEFEPEKLIFNLNDKKEFINFNYNLDDLIMEGLFIETNWVKPFNNLIKIKDNSNKLFIEYPILDDIISKEKFEQLDLKIQDILNDNNKELYVNNLKKTILEKYNFVYENIRFKININECEIILDDNIYNKSINDLNIKNMDIKCVISSHGIWKYDNKFGITWRVLKLYLKTNKEYNLNYYLNGNFIKNNIMENLDTFNNIHNIHTFNNNIDNYNKLFLDENHDKLNLDYDKNQNNLNSYNKKNNIQIPNFELEFD